MKFKIFAINLPANTSHFPQPCDSHINKHFKKKIKVIRDQLFFTGEFWHAKMSFQMKLVKACYRAISTEMVKKSLVDVGLWPLCNSFVNKLRDKFQRRLEAESISTENRSQKVRRSDRLLCKDRVICSEL